MLRIRMSNGTQANQAPILAHALYHHEVFNCF